MSVNYQRYLIVNADDFGLSPGINSGIMEAHRQGIVTSASLMVHKPAAIDAVAMARGCPKLSLGLHLDLGEWAYRNGEWQQLYQVVDLADGDAVQREVTKQFDWFCELMGGPPTHLDSHQHVHFREPVGSAMRALAAQLEVPLRQCSADVAYCGGFYGQTEKGVSLPDSLKVESLLQILSELAPGITELGCHPGFADELDSMYCVERRQEIDVLCDERIKHALADLNIGLISFRDVARAVGSGAHVGAPRASGKEAVPL